MGSEVVWVILHDDATQGMVEAVIAEMPTKARSTFRLQRTGSRSPPAVGGMVASELADYGFEPGETNTELAIELLEAIGDGAVRLICVSPAPVTDSFRRFCTGREITLLAGDQGGFAERLRSLLLERLD